MRVLVVALCLASGATARRRAPRSHELTLDYSYEQYTKDFGKSATRAGRETFLKNLGEIVAHNAREGKTYTRGVNQFTDEPNGPPRGLHGGHLRQHQKAQLRSAPRPEPLPFELKRAEDLPAAVDWRAAGIVSAVKDQGGCGSCWAFATTAVMESHVAKETGVLFNLSPQELVSCMPNPEGCGGSGGCEGAIAELGFAYYMGNGGVVQEYQMGYTSYYGEDGECYIKNISASRDGGPDPSGITTGVANITGFTTLPANDYGALLNAVAQLHPIAVSVDAMAWSSYEGGVYVPSDEDYASPDIDHAVTLVGYGVDDDSGLAYWLVRNSWSPTWGEGGYIRIVREADGQPKCGVDTTPLDGFGCEGGATNITVCGASGILSDSSFPTGGYLL